jgi:hypothetical protein
MLFSSLVFLCLWFARELSGSKNASFIIRHAYWKSIHSLSKKDYKKWCLPYVVFVGRAATKLLFPQQTSPSSGNGISSRSYRPSIFEKMSLASALLYRSEVTVLFPSVAF